MLTLFRKHSEFTPPPCLCDDIEARVEEACAMRDEMATWPTPLEAWKRLQAMPALVPKGEPDAWVKSYELAWKRVVTGPVAPVPMYVSMKPSPPTIVVGPGVPGNLSRSRHVCHDCGSKDLRWTNGTDNFCDGCWSRLQPWR